MSTKRIVVGALGVMALGVGWYLFRPERLWINQTVNETLDVGGATAANAMPATGGREVLARGMFHGVSHETRGAAMIVDLGGGQRVLRLMDFETSNGPDVQVYLVAATDAKDNATVTKAGFLPLGALKGNIGDQNYALPADVDLSKYRAVTIWCRRFGVNFGTAPLIPESGSMSAGTESMSSATESMSSATESMSAGTETAMGGNTVLASGTFHSVAHETRGAATVYGLAGDRRVLRLTGFETSNGPDVQVYLVAAADASDNATVTRAGFVRLASLKGNVGDQNYELPSDVDLSKYRAVTIWCRRFGVNFGTAPLAAPHS